MQNTIKKVYLVGCLLLFFILTHAQYSTELINGLKEEYKKENIIQLENNVTYDISIDNDKLEIFLERKVTYVLLKNAVSKPFYQSTLNSAFIELVDFEANSYIYDGKKFKKKAVKEYTEKSNMDNNVFYDDVREYKFHFSGLTDGSIVEFITTHKIVDPHIMPSTFLKKSIPVHHYSLTINYDDEIKLDFLKFNMDQIDVNIQELSKNGKNHYVLESKKLDAELSEDFEPGFRYFSPHIIPLIRHYSVNGEKINILSDNRALYKWNYKFIKELINAPVLDPIKNLADSITKLCVTDKEKVEKLYYWVQNNIKYIAFEDGLGGLVPRKPEQILNNQYGDCKDKTSILYALLKSVGVNSYFTWIGTTQLPYTYQEVSSPSSDNHMILTYIDKDSIFHFLDGTGRFHWYSVPTSFIQGKEALIAINEDEFTIQEVPIPEASSNLLEETVKMTIVDNVIHGKGLIRLNGYEKLDAQYYLNTDDKKKQKEVLEKFLEIGNNKFVLADYKLTDFKNFNQSMEIEYTFTLDNYINKSNEKIYLNMNMFRKWLALKPKKNRKHPLKIEYLDADQIQFELEIPEGYKLEYLPEDSKFESDWFKYNIDYEQSGNVLIYKHYIEIKELLFSSDQIDELRNFISQLEKTFKQTVILSKN